MKFTLLFVALALSLFASRAFSQPSYNVIDLGTLGGPTSTANAVNNAGVVVGSSTNAAAPDVSRAFRWENGVMTDIGSLGGPSAYASDINETGQITGGSETFDSLPTYQKWHAYRWTNGVMSDLGTTGGHDSHGDSINASGIVVGRSMICWDDPESPPGTPCFPVGNEYAARWIGNSGTDLGGLGGADSEAYGISDSGVAAGQANLGTGQQNRRATVWINGQAQNLGSLGGTGFNSWGLDINNANVVTGFSDTPENLHHHSFIYDLEVGQMVDIGAPPGHADSEAWAINNLGQVVGQTGSEVVFGDTDGFLFNGESMFDLNNLIPANSGWHLKWAFDINDNGWIVGFGRHNGQDRGYLLVPARLRGDVNCDDAVDFQDVGPFIDALIDPSELNPCALAAADLNADGAINGRDIDNMMQCVLAGGCQ